MSQHTERLADAFAAARRFAGWTLSVCAGAVMVSLALTLIGVAPSSSAAPIGDPGIGAMDIGNAGGPPPPDGGGTPDADGSQGAPPPPPPATSGGDPGPGGDPPPDAGGQDLSHSGGMGPVVDSASGIAGSINHNDGGGGCGPGGCDGPGSLPGSIDRLSQNPPPGLQGGQLPGTGQTLYPGDPMPSGPGNDYGNSTGDLQPSHDYSQDNHNSYDGGCGPGGCDGPGSLSGSIDRLSQNPPPGLQGGQLPGTSGGPVPAAPTGFTSSPAEAVLGHGNDVTGIARAMANPPSAATPLPPLPPPMGDAATTQRIQSAQAAQLADETFWHSSDERIEQAREIDNAGNNARQAALDAGAGSTQATIAEGQARQAAADQWSANGRTDYRPSVDQAINDALHILQISDPAHYESNGQRYVVNGWDSNASAGHPSVGAMQVTGPTFNANHLSGYNDLFNLRDNIIAGTRYAANAYGGVANVPGLRSIDAGGGYQGY